MITYKPGDIATALGVSISSIRNWTDQEQFQEFLSDMATRTGSYANSKQREYTQQDLYVINTIARQKTRFNLWNDVADYLRAGNLDTELPASAALVQPTAAESFADAIMLRQQLDLMANSLSNAEEEVKFLRKRVDDIREEERRKASEKEAEDRKEIIQLHRQIARLELRIELMQEEED